MSHIITLSTFAASHLVLQVVDGRPPPARIAGLRQPDPQEVSMAQAQPITALRERMLDDMRLRNMAASTRQIYVRSVADFSAFRCAVEPSSMVVRARMVQKPIVFCTLRTGSEKPRICWVARGDFGEGFRYPAAEVPWP